MNIQRFAQKGIVINDEDEILLIKYLGGKYMAEAISGKFALPGGRIEFGEVPDESVRREVREETGVNCIPGLPIYCWNWEYKKGEDLVQINAVARVCKYIDGNLAQAKEEDESTIEDCYWVHKDKVLSLDIISDERPALEFLINNYSFYIDKF